MNRKQYAFLVVIVVACSLSGGMISTRFLTPKPALAVAKKSVHAKVIESESFVLVDRAGKKRAELLSARDRTKFIIYANDKKCTELSDLGLYFYDENEKTRAWFFEWGMILSDENEKDRVFLSNSDLRFLADDGQVRTISGGDGFSVDDENRKTFRMIDDTGEHLVELNTKPRLYLTQDGLVIRNKDLKVIFRAP